MSKKTKKTEAPHTVFHPLKEYITPAGNNVLHVLGEVDGEPVESWLEWWPERDGNRPGACFSDNLPELIRFLIKSHIEATDARHS